MGGKPAAEEFVATDIDVDATPDVTVIADKNVVTDFDESVYFADEKIEEKTAPDSDAKTIPKEHLAKVLEAVKENDFKKACTLLQDYQDRSKGEVQMALYDLREALEFPGEFNLDDTVGVCWVEQNRGETVMIRYRGQDMMVIPIMCSNGVVTVNFRQEDGIISATSIQVSEMDAEGKLEMLGEPFRRRHRLERRSFIARVVLGLETGSRDALERLKETEPRIGPLVDYVLGDTEEGE